MPARFYFDCTETARVGAHTGIQRTVRSLTRAAIAHEGDAIAPVHFDGRAFAPLDARVRERLADPAPGGRHGIHERARRLAVAVLSRSDAGAGPARPGGGWVADARDLASRSYWAARGLRPGGAGVPFGQGDWLVLLDATWAPDLRPEIARAHARGARVCAVVYDLIKLRYPNLVSPGAARIYGRWLERVLPQADVIATISHAVAGDLVRYLGETGRSALAARVHPFPLGADFAMDGAAGDPSPAVREALAEGRERTFLAVGSIEARKDQATILDAFERVWREGGDARLVLVGRPGWGGDAVARRLAAHAQRDRRLFWFAQASDADLAHCYRHARALVNVSLCEGFGLPLAEAMRAGLRIIASDIPPFREVAGPSAVFVPTGDPEALARAVMSMQRDPGNDTAKETPAVATWADSAQALVRLLRDQGPGSTP
ncbi:MAG: glycosyltransferase family 1 protein [Burkholderiales bacterium]